MRIEKALARMIKKEMNKRQKIMWYDVTLKETKIYETNFVNIIILQNYGNHLNDKLISISMKGAFVIIVRLFL